MTAQHQSGLAPMKDWSLCLLFDRGGSPSKDWFDFAKESWAADKEISNEVFVVNGKAPWGGCTDMQFVLSNAVSELGNAGVQGHCRWTLVVHRPLILQLSLILKRLSCLDENLALELVLPWLDDTASCGDLPWKQRGLRIFSRGLIESIGFRTLHVEKAFMKTFNPFYSSPRALIEVFTTDREVIQGASSEAEVRTAWQAFLPQERHCIMVVDTRQLDLARQVWREINHAKSVFGRMGCWIEAYRLPEFIASSLRSCHLQRYLSAKTTDEVLARADSLEVINMPDGAANRHYFLCAFMHVTGQKVYLDQAAGVAETWAADADYMSDVEVFFFLPEGVGDVHPGVEQRSIRLVGDFDIEYHHQAVRDLTAWHFFAGHPQRPRCDWVARVDTDTWVNLRSLRDRLQCFTQHHEHHVGWPSLAWPRLGGFQPGSMALYHLNSVVLNRKLLSRMAAQNGFILCLNAIVQDWLGQGLRDELLSDCLWRMLRLWPEFLGSNEELPVSIDYTPQQFPANDCVIFSHPASAEVMRLYHNVTLDAIVGLWSMSYREEESLTYSISHQGIVNVTGRAGSVRTQLFFADGLKTTTHRFSHQPLPGINEILEVNGSRLLAKRWHPTLQRWTNGHGTRLPVESGFGRCNQLLPRDVRLYPWCHDNGTSLAHTQKSQLRSVQEVGRPCWEASGATLMDRSWCCHELFGPRGNPVCWAGGSAYTYEKCCLGLLT